LYVSKNVFQVYGADKAAAMSTWRKLQRKQVAGYFKRLKPCVVGIEEQVASTIGATFWP
jgi:transposase